MNRNRLLQRLAETSDAVERLREELVQIDKGRDEFASFLFQSRREFRRAVELSGKSGRRIKETLRSTFEDARTHGFRGSFQQWEHLLQISGKRE